MDDIFTNPFSDMYGFTVSSGGSGNPENDDSTSNNTNTNQIKEKRKEAWESESAFGTFNRPPKLMAIEDYTRWAIKFEEWLMAFAFPSWKSMKTGYAAGKNNGEVLRSNEEIDLFVAEQKCVALLFQSVREDIISLISYTNAKDLWDKLGKKCLGSKEILKNKTKLLKKEFDMFSCFKNESVCKMIERFGHLKLELARHDIKYLDEEIVDKLFDSLPDEMDWRYYALMLKNTIPPEELKPDVVIERLESHELELKKTYKVNHSYQQNPELYYPKSLMPKASSPKTAFSAENLSPAPKENQSNSNKESHSGYHSGSTSIPTTSTNRSDSKFSCNIAVDLKNAQNFDEESVKQQMVFLASVLESYEGLIAGKIGNTNLTKEDYDQIDPEEMESIDIQWAMASAVRRAQRFMEITGRKTIGGPSTKLGFDKSKDDYYKRAIYHQNKSEPPRIKQSEDNKGKSRALAVIYDDEGYDWSKEVLPEDDAIGYAFMASHNEPIQWKDNRTEQQKYEYRKMVAEAKIIRLSGVYEEATRANRWDPDRECYLDVYGNIAVDYKKIDIEAIIQEYKEEDEYWQHKWWGTPTSKMIEEEREKERREKEKIEEPVKIDTGMINTAQEMTAENLREMADKVLAVKALEVDSTPNSESKKQVSQTKSSTVSGNKNNCNADCKSCNKQCNFCTTVTYLNGEKIKNLTDNVRKLESQILDCDKELWGSFDMRNESDEEEDFFDELDVFREYESSLRFPAEYTRRSSETSNDNEAGPSNTGDHEDEGAPGNESVVNDNQEAENMPMFDDSDSDLDGEQIQVLSQTNQVSEQDAEQNVTNLEGNVDVPDEVMPRTLSYHPEEQIIGDLQSGVRTRHQLDQGLSMVDGIVSVDAETTVDDDDKQSAMGRGRDTNKGHNVPSAIDEVSTKGTEAEKMAECLRKSRIAKALSDTTLVYESHVRRFWDTARFEEKDNKIHAVVKKKDKNNKDIDVEVVFGVEDIRRVLDLQDSDNDPTIMSERLAKGLWCRLGFSSHINGKMFKRSFSSQYRYLMHCLVHSLSHRKGAYDEVSDYIMNIVVKNCLAGKDKYIMYPRFIMMILDDKVKNLPKNNDDIMAMAEVNKTAILRITKEKDAKTKELICALKDEAYVAPENDKWRHDNSDSDNEDNKMSEMIEKKTRWWCIKDGKRKRTPKSTPVVVIKETAKGSSEEPQRKLIDEPVIEPREVVDKGVGLKETLESYFKKHEEAEQAQAQRKVGQEEEAEKNSSNEDSEETLSESELVKETVGKGKVQLKKRPLKKRKNSEDEDSPYNPEDSQKNRKKRKATRSGDIPRVVRAKKQNAISQKEKEGKKKQDTAESSPVVEIPKEVPLTEIPIETHDDYVEITGVKSTKQTSDRHDIPESSQRKTDYFNLDFDSLGGATGDFFQDMPESEGDLFHDKKMKELEEKVKVLEKEKEENEAVQVKLKEMIDELEKRHEDVMDAVLTKDEKLNEMKEDIKDNAEIISTLTDEIAALNAKVKDLQNINQTLNQLLNEVNEASTNEMKAMKLEMEAMRADKVMKDKQLEMLTAVIEAHLKVNIHEAFDQVDIIKANERRKERERQLAEEANLKNKGIAEEVEVVGSSQNQLEVGGSSSQPEIEMVDAQDVTANDEEMVEAENEAVHEPEFIMIGESVEPIIPENVLRDVQIIQRKKKAKEVLLLEYSTDKFVLVGKAYRVPYSEEESAKLLRFHELKDQGKIARGEVEEEESDSDFWEEEDEDDDKDDKADDKSDDDDKPDDDDDDQGTSGLLINDPSVQDKVNELMNDEVNEQNDDAECEGSSSGNQSGDQVHQLTSTFISLSEYHQGEVDIIRTRSEMLEELGLEDGKFKFDIEDEIPESPIKNFEPQFPLEAEFYDNVTIETDSDSEEERIDFHYEGEDMAFPTFTELFEDMNAELLKRKIEERVASADMPEPVPREISAEERKKWFRSMPKERKPLRALQYFTHDKDLSWGDILSWGYLEDLNVYAIRREQGVQYFRCISDLATLPWWDVDELVVTKNIKQHYYGPEVKQRDQKLWNYIKYQATINYPDWKPQFPKRIVKYTAKGEKDVTLDVKPPKCLKSMPLRAIEQDFYDLFQAWLYNPSTAEAVISLYDKDAGEARKICILDPMWLVNCSKKDIDCLFVNKIIYDKKDKAIAQQYQSVVDVCFAKEINSGKNWKTSWRDIEVDEFLKVYKRSLRSKEIQRKAAERGRRNLGFVPPTDQTPIESEENKIPKWDRKRDGDPVYRNWWITEGRHKRRQMLAEREEKRKQKARDRRRNRR
ncbi:putative leucine-rich repeat-containing protein DDB_G0290503 [Helianthus annuus]|uniref:putative leucine-rich repeat-containing protein DDB_G0290503 n=1 Tax=Helianthus annuus TaxID=4232 RepID=UPI0016532D5B|nr:putative leucine-rich repeat-containing protein DDB_G0290503 [Helianthus annuus]